ncbi:MAG TPA: hypothetical protein VGF46_03865 [Gaiellales bacterium]|jgi:hypothetical protein
MTTLHYTDELALLGADVDDLLLHIRGLVLVRDLLVDRGASEHEIDAHTEELERRRLELAAIIGPGNWA